MHVFSKFDVKKMLHFSDFFPNLVPQTVLAKYFWLVILKTRSYNLEPFGASQKAFLKVTCVYVIFRIFLLGNLMGVLKMKFS